MDLATCDAETAFAELIYADAQWLREEFDALIAASFGQPPAAPPPAPPRVPPRRPPAPPPRWQRQPIPPLTTGRKIAPGHRRQRSPPA
jgi:hypothetical protein